MPGLRRLFLITLLLLGLLPAAALAEGQRVILVLDASGSMWGQVEGLTKMEIAKDVVAKVIGRWKAEDEIGLVAYGHRRKGSCDDIETLIEPGPLNADSYLAAVRGLNPKGKTPMTQAVRQAAEALKFTEKQATVILVSDGIETCDPNPCAVAEELERLGVALTVHTVGFILDDKGAVEQLKCLAEKTGGIAILADNADELEGALTKTVEATTEAPPPPAAPDFNFTGHVVMAEGVELPHPWDQPAWTFSQAAAGQPGQYLRTEYGREIKITLDQPGEMFAVVKTDFAEVMAPFSLAQGGTAEVTTSLNAGVVAFKGMLDTTTQMMNDGAAWTISKADGTYVGTTYGVTPRHLLNAGAYTVKLQDGQAAEAQASFTVTAGKEVEVVVSLGSGSAKVTAVYVQGGEAVSDRMAVELRKPAGVSGESQHLATEYGNGKLFKAAAGDYVAVVSLDHARAEAPVAIAAGKEVAVTVALNAGFLAIKAPGAKALEVFGAQGIEGTRPRIGGEYADALNQAFTAGDYHVVAYGEGNAVLAEKDVTVVAGKRTEVTLP